jgi:hypothetical protein
MRKAFDWKRSRISMLEVEAVTLDLYLIMDADEMSFRGKGGSKKLYLQISDYLRWSPHSFQDNVFQGKLKSSVEYPIQPFSILFISKTP